MNEEELELLRRGYEHGYCDGVYMLNKHRNATMGWFEWQEQGFPPISENA